MESPYAPPAPTNVSLRPLKTGIREDLPSTQMINGSFLDLLGVNVLPDGLLRVGSWTQAETAGVISETDEWPLQGALTYRNSSGNKYNLIIGSKGLYNFNRGSGVSAVTMTIGETSYELSKPVKSHIDYTLVQQLGTNKVVIVDGSFQGFYTVDGGTFGKEDLTFTPTSAEWYSGYLWLGKANTLYWSSPTDFTDFSGGYYFTFDTKGDIVKIKGLGNILVVYFKDCVWYGRATNLIDLPFIFTKVGSDAAGLVGKQAIVEYDDAHFFLGPDDVYYLSADSGFKSLGSPVYKSIFNNSSFPDNAWKSHMEVDSENACLWVYPGVDTIGADTEDPSIDPDPVYLFNIKTAAWSKMDIQGAFFKPFSNVSLTTWADPDIENLDLSSATWGTYKDSSDYFYTWGDLKQTASENKMYGFLLDSSSIEMVYFDSFSSSAVDVIVESGDIDFDLPDTIKTVQRLSLKVDRVLDEGEVLQFALYTSTDRGRSFEYQGDLTITGPDEEDKINFRATGSTFRFKLVSKTSIKPYTIIELGLRLRPRGVEK